MISVRNIILAGFMATGKTTVGQIVADYVGWRFIDTDEEIERRVGLAIPEIFARDGEQGFRRWEKAVCQSVAAQSEQVVATGGGMLVDAANRELMLQSGLVVCLNASPQAIRERLGDFSWRPLAPNWEALLEQRREAYATLPYQIDTTDLSPEEVAERVIALCK